MWPSPTGFSEAHAPSCTPWNPSGIACPGRPRCWTSGPEWATSRLGRGRPPRAPAVTLETVGLEASAALAAANQGIVTWPVSGDARALPFADHSVDVVTCSQVLHHFFDADARFVLAEMNRVARVQAIVSDIHRSRIAAAGIWLASFALAFHPASRHDAVVSVMRGFHAGELRQMVRETVGVDASVQYRPGYRITASWAPSLAPGPSVA